LVIGIITFATVAGAADVLHWRGWVWTRVHRARLSSLALVILIPALGLCWYLLRIRPDLEQVARRGRAAHLPFERYPGESEVPTMSAATTDTTPKIGSFGNLRAESKLPASDDLPVVAVSKMTLAGQDTPSPGQEEGHHIEQSASPDLPSIPIIEPIRPSATAPPAIEGRVVPQPTEAATPVGPRSPFGTRPSYRPVQRSWIDTSSSAISAESVGDITDNTGSDLAVSPIPAGGATAVLNRPASAQKAEVTHHDEPDPQASHARAGWLPDPLGRHQHRWWDGSSWTDAVVNDNTPSRDSGA
jgi:hypothetical protein